MDALADWIRQQGGTVHLEIHDERGEGRGVIATRAIEHGARILSVPHALLLTPAVVASSPVGRALERCAASSALSGDQQYPLAVYLVLSQRGHTPWMPYAAALPARAPDVPVTYDDTELALLEGSYILARVRRERELFHREYDAMLEALPDTADCTFDEFLRVRTLVPSRAFAVLGSEALVPMADMLNHRQVPDVEWGYEHPTESFVMRAARDIAAGEALHDSYGKKSNALLFEIYGFCIDAPDRDEAELRLPAIDPRHPLAGGTSTFGRSVGGERAFLVSASAGRAEESAAVTYLRRALGTDAPLEGADPRVCRAMSDACDRALAGFPNAAHDDALLASPTLGVRARNCLRIRGGERRVLAAVRARYEVQ
jgi:histone-lysine N-methyltransferase SETD3